MLLALFFSAEMTVWMQQAVVAPWTHVLAATAAALARLFYPAAVASGLTLTSPSSGFGVLIAPGCNGVEAVIMLAAAMLAFPAPWRHKALGLALGFVAVQGLNVLRIVSLFALGQWSREVFEIAHLYVWQALIMLDVLVVWWIWVRRAPARVAA